MIVELIDAENQSAEYLKPESEIKAVEKRLVMASALPLQELLAQAAGQYLALVKALLERAGGDLQPNTPTKDGGKADFALNYELNLCRNGMPPSEGMDLGKAAKVLGN